MPDRSIVTEARYQVAAKEDLTPQGREALSKSYSKYEPNRIKVYATRVARAEWERKAKSQGISLSRWLALAGAEKAEGGNAVIESLQREKLRLEEELYRVKTQSHEMMERNLALENKNRSLLEQVLPVLDIVKTLKEGKTQ